MIVRLYGEHKYATDLFARAINSVGENFYASSDHQGCFLHVLQDAIESYYAVFIDAHDEMSQEFEEAARGLGVRYVSVSVDELVKKVRLLDTDLGRTLIDSGDNLYKVAAVNQSINTLDKQRIFDFVHDSGIFVVSCVLRSKQ